MTLYCSRAAAPECGWRDWIGPYATWVFIGAVLIVVGVLPIWV